MHVRYQAVRCKGGGSRITQAGRAVARPDRVAKHERARAVARQVFRGAAAPVKRQQQRRGRARDGNGLVKVGRGVEPGARGVRGALGGRGNAGHGRGREAHELHAVVGPRGDKCKGPAADRLECVDAVCARELVESVLALGGRGNGRKRAAFVHADQLDSAVGLGGDYGVRSAAHLKKVRGLGPVEPVKAPLSVRGGPLGLDGAVVVHPDQLRMGAIKGRHHCERAIAAAAAARLDGGDKVGTRKARKAGVRARGGGYRPQGAVVVHPDQLHAVVLVRRHNGHRGAVCGAKRRHGAGSVERQVAVAVLEAA